MITQLLHEEFPFLFKETSRAEGLRNLRSNLAVIISYLAFICLSFKTDPGVYIGAPLGVIAALFILSRYGSVWNIVHEAGRPVKIFSLFTAAGISLNGFVIFGKYYGGLPFLYHDVLPAVLAAVSIPCLFVALLYFYGFLGKLADRTGCLRQLTRAELLVYCMLFVALCALATVMFSSSYGIYEYGPDYDVIYTTDSKFQFDHNVFLSYFEIHENDIRQPLFMLLAAPFEGLAYLIGSCLSPLAKYSTVLFMDFAQIAMLLAGNYLLSLILGLNDRQRMGFMVLLASTYTIILSSIVIEQYITSYFWLMLLVYVTVTGSDTKYLNYCAMGTCITSVVISPITRMRDSQYVSFLRSLGVWFKGLLIAVIGMIIAIIIAGRADVFLSTVLRAGIYASFTGSEVTAVDHVKQFLDFVEGMFVAPAAGVFELNSHLTWQLCEHVSYNIVGIAILLVSFLSLIIHRKSFTANIFGAWVVFSILLLGVIGWGVAENGLILYCLYFQWAYVGLFAMLIKTAYDRVGHPILWILLGIVTISLLLWFNIQSISDMIAFASENYPGV